MTGSAFRFRLERVRAVRERTEKLAKQDLAQAISRRASTEEELRATEANIAQAHVEQRSVAAEPGTISAGELQVRQSFLERIEAQRNGHARDLAQREAEVAESDAKLTAAASEHEMLNRLRERHRGEHDREAARVERNSLDEIASSRFGRSSA
ncbi:MAG TPA: flagellar export protein FliJ [Solirubrobacteraceae bacterium]|nr:flagellar export protein FliJ [Solirubrobacteraceae bacterium]